MVRMKIEVTNNNYVEFEIYDYVQFIGGNQISKERIYTSFQLMSKKGFSTAIEKYYYGENGLEIIYDDKLIKAKDIHLVLIENKDSLVKELTCAKGTLMYEVIETLNDSLEFTRELEKLNDQMLVLESLINNLVNLDQASLSFETKNIELEELIKLFIYIYTNKEELSEPIEYLSTEEVFEIFINYLDVFAQVTQKPIWLVLNYPETILNDSMIQKLINKVQIISKETSKIHLFIFWRKITANDDLESLDKTILLYEEFQQLPEYDIFRKSVERYYPDEMNLTDIELLHAFYRISPYIGINVKNNYLINDKDMVLLLVLKDLLGDKTTFETSKRDLSKAEIAFLKSRL